jgi:hypothetical protein
MKAICLAVGIVGLAACASTPPPHEREASSEAAIRAANEVGAQQVPQAALHLKLAQEQFEKAKKQMQSGDNAEASYTLLRSQADAELALAMAREEKTRSDAEQVLAKVRAVRGEHPAQANPSQPAIGGGP